MADFYLTLPSNSSSAYFNDNKLFNYKTRLETNIDLEGEYDVGLSEIIFPRNWYSVKKGAKLTVSCSNCPNVEPEFNDVQSQRPATYSIELRLAPGYYETMDDLIKTINATVELVFAKPITSWTKDGAARRVNEKGWPSFRLNELNQHVYVTLQENMIIQFEETLATILGFDDSQLLISNYSKTQVSIKSNNVCDIFGGIHHMFVYCDVLESVAVGHTSAPLLRIVETKAKHREIVYKNYQNNVYSPLHKKLLIR